MELNIPWIILLVLLTIVHFSSGIDDDCGPAGDCEPDGDEESQGKGPEQKGRAIGKGRQLGPSKSEGKGGGGKKPEGKAPQGRGMDAEPTSEGGGGGKGDLSDGMKENPEDAKAYLKYTHNIDNTDPQSKGGSEDSEVKIDEEGKSESQKKFEKNHYTDLFKAMKWAENSMKMVVPHLKNERPHMPSDESHDPADESSSHDHDHDKHEHNQKNNNDHAVPTSVPGADDLDR